MSARASSTQLGREKEPHWGQTQVWRMPLPPKFCATRILESPLSLKINSWDKTNKLRIKTHPFTMVYKTASLTTLCFTPFTPDTLAFFQALVLAVWLATTGPLHVLFSLPRMLFSLAFTLLAPPHLSHLSSKITSSRILFWISLIKSDSPL